MNNEFVKMGFIAGVFWASCVAVAAVWVGKQLYAASTAGADRSGNWLGRARGAVERTVTRLYTAGVFDVVIQGRVAPRGGRRAA